MEDNDAQLELKKRARRRLVGAMAFAGFAAVVLPMVMDQEPKEESQDVEIRIPGQDEKPFAPKFASAPAVRPVPAEVSAEAKVAATAGKPTAEPPKPQPEPVTARPGEPAAKVIDKNGSGGLAKTPEKPLSAKAPEATPKGSDKTAQTTAGKPAEKMQAEARPRAEPVTSQDADSRRAAAILAGRSPDTPPASSQFVILIGAYNNPANVRNLQNKLGELGLKVYTEPLDTPQGRKTRVRAGPFANRDAAEKALDRMKRIGVPGVLSPRQ